MPRLFIYVLIILHVAPGIAFTLLAFGCNPYVPSLGGFCGQGLLLPFMQITLIATLALAGAFALFERLRTR